MICDQIEAVSFGWRRGFTAVDIVQRMRRKQFRTRSPKWTVCFCRGNIPGGDVQAGEELCHYLPPFPAKGTGFHRYVYVLFKQEGPVDFQGDARPSPWWAGSRVLIRALKLFSNKNTQTDAGSDRFSGRKTIQKTLQSIPSDGINECIPCLSELW